MSDRVQSQILQAMKTDLQWLREKRQKLEEKSLLEKRTTKHQLMCLIADRELNRAERRLARYEETGELPYHAVVQEEPTTPARVNRGFSLLGGRRDFNTLKGYK